MNMVKASKFLSLVLRHKPETIGLSLDDNGWADVTDLLMLWNVHNTGSDITMDFLEEVVKTNNKKRFAFNDDKTKIRASQGHSLNIDLGLEPKDPPAKLYHGTAERFCDSIKQKGLVKGSRQHVHLSVDCDTATKVGSRHGSPKVIIVDAAQMVQDGHKFYLSDNDVWLVDEVPVKYLNISHPAVCKDYIKEAQERYDKHPILLQNIKDNLPELEELLEKVNSHGIYEDLIYRFYHHSFKVYYIQENTCTIVKALKKISPHDDSDCINEQFDEIFKEGNGKVWERSHNRQWMKICRPMVEAFFHARFFLDMAVKYGKELDEAPQVMPSGWAALTHLYNIR